MAALEDIEHGNGMTRLREIVARLRAPDGCPWDREQTHRSLRAYAIEEAYEVAGAIDSGDPALLREELGDYLLQVVLHAQIAEEAGAFDLDAVAHAISDKLVRRHPHVFSSASVKDSEGVLAQWDAIKRAEKGETVGAASLLDGVARGLPALMEAADYQKKAARAGFDWATAAEVAPKVKEELEEATAAIASGDPAHVEEEIGDLLFAAVNLARKAKVNPEVALHAANRKFANRFRAMERELARQGKDPASCTLAELDAVWDAVKAAEQP